MQDYLLLLPILLSEKEPPTETDITLIVGGFLISGFVISAKKYWTHHPISEGFDKAIAEMKAKALPQEKEEADTSIRNFIHLRDAQYYIPGQVPIPAEKGTYVRISLDSVLGFSFGRLTIAPN
jgi:hypothetical protein